MLILILEAYWSQLAAIVRPMPRLSMAWSLQADRRKIIDKKRRLKPVFRIRISFHADMDPDPGSQKFPYGSGCGSGSKEVNPKEE